MHQQRLFNTYWKPSARNIGNSSSPLNSHRVAEQREKQPVNYNAFEVHKFSGVSIKDKMIAETFAGWIRAFQAKEAVEEKKEIQSRKYSVCNNIEKWNSTAGFRKFQEVWWFRVMEVKWNEVKMPHLSPVDRHLNFSKTRSSTQTQGMLTRKHRYFNGPL